MLNQPAISSRPPFRTLRRASHIYVVVGRVLFFLTCFLLIAMPWTEHFWTFDRFLRGGQDMELGLFALLSFLCLVLVLSQHFKQALTNLLAILQSESFTFRMTSDRFHPSCA